MRNRRSPGRRLLIAWAAPALLLAAFSSVCRAEGAAIPSPAPQAVTQGSLDFSTLETLVIQDAGRKKPLNTYATEQMECMVGRPLFGAPYWEDKSSGSGIRVGPMDMLLSMWFGTRNWSDMPVVLISYGPLVERMGLPVPGKLFSGRQIEQSPQFTEIMRGLGDKEQSQYTPVEKEFHFVLERLQLLHEGLKAPESLKIIPHPSDPKGTWLSIAQLEAKGASACPQERTDAVLAKYRLLGDAYRQRDAAAFKKASSEFRDAVAALSPAVYPPLSDIQREVSLIQMRPFGTAWVLYLLAIVAGAAGIKFLPKSSFAVAAALACAGLGYHAYGMITRCYISGRPPVTNMYESMLWVGLGALVFGLIFEAIYRRKYFLFSGLGGAFACLMLLDLIPVLSGNSAMPGFESKIAPLQPVLRNNFWLTVHVLTITLSYAAFLLAWVLGHITLAKTLFDRAPQKEHGELHEFLYRVNQVGVLLLAMGTILGGVWAHYSWGRFWGWDPKENWALIALLCYILVLHGRLAGWWGKFGFAAGSVICFQAVIMAWYGVNFVFGSGLHSYGSGQSGKELVIGGALIVLDIIFTFAAILKHRRQAAQTVHAA